MIVVLLHRLQRGRQAEGFLYEVGDPVEDHGSDLDEAVEDGNCVEAQAPHEGFSYRVVGRIRDQREAVFEECPLVRLVGAIVSVDVVRHQIPCLLEYILGQASPQVKWWQQNRQQLSLREHRRIQIGRVSPFGDVFEEVHRSPSAGKTHGTQGVCEDHVRVAKGFARRRGCKVLVAQECHPALPRAGLLQRPRAVERDLHLRALHVALAAPAAVHGPRGQTEQQQQ
mmetsp:Transcript_30364/g.86897  ORF Transcript_30364/g.86897 Transcript_30364/m.86897 type:complete len:226 (+) Transcript_30364:1152-1829(+)